jgi:hypothetical protein
MSRKKSTIQWLDDLWDPSRKPKQGYILLLNGVPSVDKPTTAQTIKAKLPTDTTRLIDDHTLMCLAEAIIPDRGAWYEEVSRFRTKCT